MYMCIHVPYVGNTYYMYYIRGRKDVYLYYNTSASECAGRAADFFSRHRQAFRQASSSRRLVVTHPALSPCLPARLSPCPPAPSPHSSRSSQRTRVTTPDTAAHGTRPVRVGACLACARAFGFALVAALGVESPRRESIAMCAGDASSE